MTSIGYQNLKREPLPAVLGDGTQFNMVGSVWIATLAPANHDRYIYQVFVNGPSGSQAHLWFGDVQEDGTPFGSLNQQEYNTPKLLYRGLTLFVVWNTGTGSQAQAVISFIDQTQDGY